MYSFIVKNMGNFFRIGNTNLFIFYQSIYFLSNQASISFNIHTFIVGILGKACIRKHTNLTVLFSTG